MFLSWANKQLERVSQHLAPPSSDPSHRFTTAISNQNVEFALALLSHSPPPNTDGTPSESLDIYSIINKQKRTTPIHYAAEHGASSIVFHLINEKGVSAELFDGIGNTPLHYAAMSKHPNAFSLVQSLVNDYNASVTAKNASGETPYDVSTNDRIRQWLLPKQLQKETQDCLDNGGVGLPEGIDLGGLSVSRINHIPPPPTSMTASSTPNDYVSSPPPPIANAYTPVVNANMNDNSTDSNQMTSTHTQSPSLHNTSNTGYNTAQAPMSQPSPATTSSTHNPGTASAPSSGQHAYARRGYSTAAVLPSNSKYQPDGFHSSASDVNLQRKYGHSHSNISVGPPPKVTPGAYGNSSSYGISRYPTYDALSNTVGSASIGTSSAMYNTMNPYNYMNHTAPSNYNIFNPVSSSTNNPTYTSTHPSNVQEQQPQQQQQQQYSTTSNDYQNINSATYSNGQYFNSEQNQSPYITTSDTQNYEQHSTEYAPTSTNTTEPSTEQDYYQQQYQYGTHDYSDQTYDATNSSFVGDHHDQQYQYTEQQYYEHDQQYSNDYYNQTNSPNGYSNTNTMEQDYNLQNQNISNEYNDHQGNYLTNNAMNSATISSSTELNYNEQSYEFSMNNDTEYDENYSENPPTESELHYYHQQYDDSNDHNQNVTTSEQVSSSPSEQEYSQEHPNALITTKILNNSYSEGVAGGVTSVRSSSSSAADFFASPQVSPDKTSTTASNFFSSPPSAHASNSNISQDNHGKISNEEVGVVEPPISTNNDESISPPPPHCELESMNDVSLEKVDLLPPPPMIGGDFSSDYDVDELPPPPMIDISLSDT